MESKIGVDKNSLLLKVFKKTIDVKNPLVYPAFYKAEIVSIAKPKEKSSLFFSSSSDKIGLTDVKEEVIVKPPKETLNEVDKLESGDVIFIEDIKFVENNIAVNISDYVIKGDKK